MQKCAKIGADDEKKQYFIDICYISDGDEDIKDTSAGSELYVIKGAIEVTDEEITSLILSDITGKEIDMVSGTEEEKRHVRQSPDEVYFAKKLCLTLHCPTSVFEEPVDKSIFRYFKDRGYQVEKSEFMNT
ncbi:MAG: hypothetical protein U9Q92_03760 [archaeon]|nr:hypothetical protein [archaeon]